MLLGICIGAAQAGQAVEADALPVVNLEGQRKFLASSVAWCVEHVPELKGELTGARNRAESQIQKAEAQISEQIAPTIKADRTLLDTYIASWSKNADALLASLKKQKPDSACPTLRDSWAGVEADVIVEDWQRFLEQNRQDAQ